MTVNGPMAMGLAWFSRGHRNLVRDFGWESSFRRKLPNSISLLWVIRRSGTKVFTRLLSPKPNAIQWEMR